MNRYLLATTVFGAIAITGNASANLITFDDGQPNGNLVGSFYLAQGVTFTNAIWADNFGLPGSSGSQGLVHSTFGYQPPQSNPIGALFSTTMSSVTLRGIDIGAQGFRLKAFNAANALVDSQVILSDQGNDIFGDLTVTGAISRIEFSQDNDSDPNDGIVFDNLSFTAAPVPEPATVATLGLGALAIIRKRRARK